LKRPSIRAGLALALMLFFPYSAVTAEAASGSVQTRQALYMKTAAVTGVPWYILAAIDQYERNIQKPGASSPGGIQIPEKKWSGALNPKADDNDPYFIALFNGFGKDGNRDGKAERANLEDALYAMADYLAAYGPGLENVYIGLWDYYRRDKAVAIISEIAELYRRFGRIDLDKRAFPIPNSYRYDYRSTWGARRGWGGLRIHEGTDIFADYGTPVRATTYGFIETIGWNQYGGWRLGIRDPKNIYHYFAHLSGYVKGLKRGDVVMPGQIVGYVGSSGYGPKGTQGKFPPHLHYGMYKYNGKTEYSFDPFPYLKTWERLSRRR